MRGFGEEGFLLWNVYVEEKGWSVSGEGIYMYVYIYTWNMWVEEMGLSVSGEGIYI